MEFAPGNSAGAAGLALRQSSDYYYTFVLIATMAGESEVCLMRRDARNGDGEEKIAGRAVVGAVHFLKVEARGQEYDFLYAKTDGDWDAVARGVDGRILSTPVAGGFVGAYIGMYATSDGDAPDSGYADFDYFGYKPL